MLYLIVGLVIGFMAGIWKDEIFAAVKKAGETVMEKVSKKTPEAPK